MPVDRSRTNRTSLESVPLSRISPAVNAYGALPPAPGASRVLPARSRSWKSGVGSRSRMPIGNWWFSWHTTVSFRAEPAYMAGTHSPPRARSAAPDSRSSITPVQGSLGVATTLRPASAKSPALPARYSGR